MHNFVGEHFYFVLMLDSSSYSLKIFFFEISQTYVFYFSTGDLPGCPLLSSTLHSLSHNQSSAGELHLLAWFYQYPVGS